ncbi:hypothetical protein A3Q56_07448 [Intoshia linei]|uniref:Uncharacterized protein n=1 Tax=Intoshia linei TaxID=1819745 RepID=A0A177ATZ5_9BILA|nr:hypothetical protein A3Q56_07448 [Intoshia linei]
MNGGAMENWGLVIYVQRYLLLDKTLSGPSNLLVTSSIISHEVAHDWYGNTITTDWWDSIVINEGVANYLMYSSLLKIYPEWKMEQFIMLAVQKVILHDIEFGDYPIINLNLQKSEDIHQIFNTIVYNKGMSIFFMIEQLMGYDVLQQKLSNFVKINENKTVNIKQFENHLAKNVRDVPIYDILYSWMRKCGNVIIFCYLNENKTQIIVEQILAKKYYTDKMDIENCNNTNIELQGYSKLIFAIKLFEYIDKESEYLVWRNYYYSYAYLNAMFTETETMEYINKKFRDKIIISKEYDIDKKHEFLDLHGRKLNELIYSLSLKVNVSKSVDMASKEYSEWALNNKVLNRDYIQSIFFYVVEHGNYTVFETIYDELKRGSDFVYSDMFIYAPLLTQNVTQFRFYLDFLFLSTEINPYQFRIDTMFAYICNNKKMIPEIISFFVENVTNLQIIQLFESFVNTFHVYVRNEDEKNLLYSTIKRFKDLKVLSSDFTTLDFMITMNLNFIEKNKDELVEYYQYY